MSAPSTSTTSKEYAYTPTVQAVIEPEYVEIKEEPVVTPTSEPMHSIPYNTPFPEPQMPVPCSPVYVMNQDMVISTLASAFVVGCVAGGILAFLFSKPEVVYVEQ